MGIPSFYKHLIQTIAGLTSKTRASPPAVFGLDLNCAIYHCVKKVQQRTPYMESHRTTWEKSLIDHVIAYIKQMNALVQPTEKLYIAVDGVAPMAKIRQQRMRRFKSAHTATEEARIRAEARGEVYVPTPRWDTNAITPGTQFMDKLAVALRAYARTSPAKILVSPADEPGEGEQKIMSWVRKHAPKDIVVYGLDADLIVLSLWASATTATHVDLFREEVEFGGGIKTDVHGDEEYLYLDMAHLAATLHTTYGRAGQSKEDFLTDFVGLMNLLGNDFVPHGMSLKIRDNGVERLLVLYSESKHRLVQQDTKGAWHYNIEALKEIFGTLAEEEPQQMVKSIFKKLEARVGFTPSGKSEEERALARYNDKPVEWAAEKVLVESVSVPGLEKPQMRLKKNWEALYDKHALWDASPADAGRAYLESLTWTLAYYSGAQVDSTWYYPWLLPPRMRTIATLLEAQKTLLPIPNKIHPVLKPVEQLAMVLPESSLSLLPREFAKLPTLIPHAFPCAYGSFSFGRRYLWECEPLIPLIQPHQMKNLVEMLYEM